MSHILLTGGPTDMTNLDDNVPYRKTIVVC